MPDGAVLREAWWHSAGLAFLHVAKDNDVATAKAAGEAHAHARGATPGTEAALPRHYLDALSTGAKMKRPAGESQENRNGSRPHDDMDGNAVAVRARRPAIGPNGLRRSLL